MVLLQQCTGESGENCGHFLTSQRVPPINAQAATEALIYAFAIIQLKHSKAPRRSIATEGWHPVSAMMTKYQFPELHQDDEDDNLQDDGVRIKLLSRAVFLRWLVGCYPAPPVEWEHDVLHLSTPPAMCRRTRER